MGELKGGRTTDFTDSMAAAIEDELNKLLHDDDKQTLPPDDTDTARDRRRFIAAIARGVIRHMKENPDAFVVEFTAVPSPLSTAQFSAQVQVNAQDVP
jgi:hypothetical protein